MCKNHSWGSAIKFSSSHTGRKNAPVWSKFYCMKCGYSLVSLQNSVKEKDMVDQIES